MHGARALYSSHASAWCSDLLDDTCLGKRNSVRNARQVQGAGRRWGVLRFPRSVSNGATQVTMRQLGVVTCMAPALAKCNGVRSARQVQQAVDRRWGVNSGSRDPRQHGARARGARVSAAGTCSRSARASDLRTPMVQHCQNCQTVARTLALERKRPVKPTEVFKVFKGKVGVPKLGNVPTQTVCASNACAFLSICCALLMFCQNRIGGHTRMHRNIHGGMPFYHAFGFTLQNRGTSPLFPGKPPENEMPLEVRKNLGHTEPLFLS